MKIYHATVYDNKNKKHSFAVEAKNLVEAKKRASKTRKKEGLTGAVTSVFLVNP